MNWERMESFIVAEGERGKRLDRFLAERTGRSRAEIQRLIKAGLVRVADRTVKPSYLLEPDERVELEPPPARPLLLQPEAIALRIIYEDEDLIVVDKPSGLVTHPASGHLSGTLVNGLLYHCKGRLAETGDPLRPGIVHRLDRETSGAIVVAKTALAYQDLVEQFKRGEVGKSYLALVHGIIEEEEGLIELPLRRAHFQREEIRVDAAGKGATTEFFVLGRFPAAGAGKTLVEARPRTGRTHQLRVHFRYIGHPVVGDRKYGRKGDLAPRMMLHAWRLSLWHPRTEERLEFTAPPPEEFRPWLAGSVGGSRAPQDKKGRSRDR
ncbi:MAG: RluA family pseudouridine synthase [Candidatus Bipolaricaulia bacterium]